MCTSALDHHCSVLCQSPLYYGHVLENGAKWLLRVIQTMINVTKMGLWSLFQVILCRLCVFRCPFQFVPTCIERILSTHIPKELCCLLVWFTNLNSAAAEKSVFMACISYLNMAETRGNECRILVSLNAEKYEVQRDFDRSLRKDEQILAKIEKRQTDFDLISPSLQ